MDPGWSEFSIFDLAFVEGMLPDMVASLYTRKEHQATWELWEVSLHKGGGGISFFCLSVPHTVCLLGSLLGHTTVLYLRQSSFISVSWKKIWT